MCNNPCVWEMFQRYNSQILASQDWNLKSTCWSVFDKKEKNLPELKLKFSVFLKTVCTGYEYNYSHHLLLTTSQSSETRF